MSVVALCVGHTAQDLCFIVDGYQPENYLA